MKPQSATPPSATLPPRLPRVRVPAPPASQDVTDSSIAQARTRLLTEHGLSLPNRDSFTGQSVFRFIEGQPLSRSDCERLSTWLNDRRRQSIDLLKAMQAIEPHFIPVLDLTRDGPGDTPPDQLAQDSARLLTDAQAKELRFAVQLDATLSIGVATILEAVMTNKSAKAAVTGLRFVSEPFHTTFAGTAEALRRAIKDCDTLRWVSGSPAVLGLIDRAVPCLELVAFNASFGEEELRRVLRLGKNDALSFRSDSSLAHRAFARWIRHFNQTPISTHWVCHVELGTRREVSPKNSTFDDESNWTTMGGETTTDHLCQAIQDLASTPHIDQLTLSHVEWLQQISPMTLQQNVHSGSLQTLNITSRHGLDDSAYSHAFGNTLRLKRVFALLDPVLDKRHRRELQITFKTGRALSVVLTKGFEIDALAAQLAWDFSDTSTRHALPLVTKSTFMAANDASAELDTPSSSADSGPDSLE